MKISFLFLNDLNFGYILKLIIYTNGLLEKTYQNIFQAQLKFQYLGKEDIKDYQTRKLQDIVWYFYQNSELFKRKLINNKVHPYDIKNINDIKNTLFGKE